MSSPSVLLEVPGAIPPPEEHPDSTVPWHWGDPFSEQRTATRGVVVIDRSNREILSVQGDERLSWLHLVISQHVTGLADGTGTEALVLDTQGRIDAHMVLAHENNTVWIDTDPGSTATSAMPGGGKQSLISYFEAMKFWSKVDIKNRSNEYALLSLLGPQTNDLLSTVDITLSEEPYSVSSLGKGFARRMPWPHSHSVDLVVPVAELSQWWQRITSAGARPAGSWAFDALRVESLHARVGLDTDDRAIPHEVNWIGSAAHVAKGCYRGQETVAKVHNVGRPPRNMVLLHLDGSPEIRPETGDPILIGDKIVGRIGTVAQHHELGPIALALVKRGTPVDAELLTGTEDRQVQATIDPDSVPDEKAAPGREAIARLRNNTLNG